MALGGFWRDGDVLVVHRDATLPDRCVLTGEPAAVRVPCTFRFTPRWVVNTAWLAPLAGLGILLFAVLAALRTTRTELMLPISEAAKEARRRVRITSAATCLLSLIIAGVCLVRGLAPYHANWLWGCALAMAGFTYALMRAHQARHILLLAGAVGNVVRLVGVSDDVLAGAPNWRPDSPTHPRWEFCLASGDCIVASLDPSTLVERVWLGSMLVSEARPGDKPDGHMIAIGNDSVIRGTGVAEVIFDARGPVCMCVLNGERVDPMPFPVPAEVRAARDDEVRPSAATLELALPALFIAVGVLAALLGGGTARRWYARWNAPPLAPLYATSVPTQRASATAVPAATMVATAGPIVPTSSATNAGLPPPVPCTDNAYVCAEDGREVLQCKGGRRLVTYRFCRGPAGCITHSASHDVACDQTIARQGDTCWTQGKLSCSEDGATLLSCVAGSWIRSRACAKGTCSVRSAGPPVCESDRRDK